MSNLTFKQYRNIDLSIFAALLLLSEGIATLATGKWFAAQPVAISTTFVFICIVMMRWGGFAAIHAVLGGLVFCIASGEGITQMLIYCVGNCFALLAMLWFLAFKKEGVRKDGFKLVLFIFSAYAAMVIGRWLVSLIFSFKFENLIGFATADVISLLFAVVIMFILRKMDGMIEDQKAYLFRLDRQRKEEAEANLYKPDTSFGDEDED